ncbi:MAG: putative DNA binding domain-containing protein [Chloroflexota bacterium]|nr:putative DNA binding domain-containing protein [Chloroflexota bacterium]MDE2893776.1 putative DNA binding domain-containing protein [Chloroflexota bacterium]
MNTSELNDVIALGEGFTTEFKRGMPSDLGREVCAFANASGGIILLGVTDAGKVVGVADHNRLSSEVQNTARSADPPIAVDVESVGDVLVADVPEQNGKPYSFGGRFHLRDGASSQQLSRDEIRELFFKEGLIQKDEAPCRAFYPAVELTPERWPEFAERTRIDRSLDPFAVLENLRLLKDGVMTHTGAWLLADDITRFTHQAGVTCAVFRGTTKTHILDRRDFRGNLYSIYQGVMAYLESRLNVALIPTAQGRD